jgi:hypothetical protein
VTGSPISFLSSREGENFAWSNKTDVERGRTIIVFHILNAPVVVGMAIFVFVIAAALQSRENKLSETAANSRITETHEALRSSVVETHLLVVSKLFGYPDLAKQAIEILIDAASYLSGPPSSRAVITSDYVLDWNKRGLARVAEAKALIDEHRKAGEPSGAR